MWRALFVAVLLVLSGCATEPPNAATDTQSTDQRALTPEQTTNRPNPWGQEELTVTINNTVNESRNFRPLVREALGFWSNNSTRYAGYDVTFELQSPANDSDDDDPDGNASNGDDAHGDGSDGDTLDGENPDVVIEFVETIEACANVSEPAGCAPYVTHDGGVSRPVTVEVVGSYSNESTRLILKHELGHVLGLNHSARPQSVMSPSSQLRSLPQTNATERRLPWDDSNFSVFLSGVDDAVEGIENRTEARAEIREQVSHALDYYAAGANDTVPANVSFTFVENRTDADVVVEFGELPCQTGDSGSCGQVRGIDPDEDGALERYDRLHVTLSGVDAEAVGWHVGYWLGYGFGFEDESDWPAPFRDATNEDRRSEWWRSS